LSIGIRDHEVDAIKPKGDHVVDSVAAGSTDSNHRDLRLQIRELRHMAFDAHLDPVLREPDGYDTKLAAS
jgi:hypothetical protein